LCLRCTDNVEDVTGDIKRSQSTEDTHATHFVKSLTSVLEQSEKDKEQLKSDI